MTITKGSFVSVKSKDGSTTKAIVDKVGPWSKNPKITVVNWTSIDVMTDERGSFKTKGTALPTSCTEIPDPSAPSDPIMEKWSLGKEKRGPQMMEGHYFASPLLLHGKKIGEVVDEGNGGSMMVRCKDHEIQRLFEKDCDAWLKKNHAGQDIHYSESVADWYSWYQDSRPQGKDAATHFKEEREQMDKWTKEAAAKQTPVGNTDEMVKAVSGK